VSLFGALGIARSFWPRLVSVVVVGALILSPHFSARVINQEAEAQAKRITSFFEHVLKSTGWRWHPRRSSR